MADGTAKTRQPLVVGVNHRTAGLTLRDRLFVEDEDVPTVLMGLRNVGVGQAIVISTCDRIEMITVTDAPDAVGEILADALAAHGKLSLEDIQPNLYRRTGEEAVSHLFRVASSLDSVIVGEPQVLGQLKACHRLARDQGMVEGDLEALMQAAYGAAKRVRSETAVGERPVSIAAVAVGVARDIHGSLDQARGLMLGGGDMGEVIAREWLRAGLGALDVADAGGRSTVSVAERLGARHLSADVLAQHLPEADVIVSAVGGRGHALSADMVRAALKVRRFKPQFIVDASLPSDVEPAVDRIDDAFLYDIEDLERLAVEGRASREAEALAAEEIVSAEVVAFQRGRRERTAVPAVNALREHVRRLREQALLEAGGDAERATYIMMQRLLHTPSERLRAMAGLGEDLDAAEALLRDLFDIVDAEEEDPEP